MEQKTDRPRDTVSSLLIPDILLPAQFFPERSTPTKLSGELALMWTVLADGIERYWKSVMNPRGHKRHKPYDEEEWIMSADVDWPFSFVNLCETFGLDPQAVRNALLAWKNAYYLSRQRRGKNLRQRTAA